MTAQPDNTTETAFESTGTQQSSDSGGPIIVAFSGGLDTSYCTALLRSTRDQSIVTVTVDTGGLSPAERTSIKAGAFELGAARHVLVDARADLFETQIQYLIKGNVLRGGVYPLCVGPDRVVQAAHVVRIARELGSHVIAHGSTGAGNDQVRFDVALSVLAPDLTILTPIRDSNVSRIESTAFLKSQGFSVDDTTTTYSVNRGLWGTTIGGRETLSTQLPLPEDGWEDTVSAVDAPDLPLGIEVTFKQGRPVALNGDSIEPVALIETLNELGAAHGVGRGVHVGDTILGIKGRVAFEAPAAAILIPAHRELEKVTLSRHQRSHKDRLGDAYGAMIHEAQYFDPVCRDIEAFLDSSQASVTGTVAIRLSKGSAFVEGVDSPNSMFDSAKATYGESNVLWNGRDARGFSRITGVQSLLAAGTGSALMASLNGSISTTTGPAAQALVGGSS